MSSRKSSFSFFIDWFIYLSNCLVLDNIQPYPIFSAVCGILVHLINRTSNETYEPILFSSLPRKKEWISSISNRSSRVCRAIYSEADLDLTCLRRLIYGHDTDTSNSVSNDHFSLLTQPEINALEGKELEEIVRKLTDTYQKLAKTQTKSDDNDEYLCIICYSHQIQGEFRPCRHQACLYVQSIDYFSLF